MQKEKFDQINKLNDRIEEVIKGWGFGEQNFKQLHNVQQWLANFKAEEIPIIFELLPKLHLKRDLDTEDSIAKICRHLERTFNKDFSGVHFFPLGDNPASSGSQFIYKLKAELGLSDSHFHVVFDKQIKNARAYVFIDDIIGSGRQAITFGTKHLNNIKQDCYYYSLYGYDKGKKIIADSKLFKMVFTPNIIYERDKIFSNESNLVNKERCREIAYEYGSKLYPKHPLGYEDSQAMICFIDNCPNNTLPIIWAGFHNEKNQDEPWHPLFERKKAKEDKIVQQTITHQFKSPIEVIAFFYDAIIHQNYDEAFYCFSKHFRGTKYQDDVEYFKNGFKNTGSIKGIPKMLVIEHSADYARVLIHYNETARVFEFNRLTGLFRRKLKDLKSITKDINAFEKKLINSLNVQKQRFDEIPIHLLLSSNVVEDICWSAGVAYDKISASFEGDLKSITRVKYVDLKVTDASWEIDSISPVFPSNEPYL